MQITLLCDYSLKLVSICEYDDGDITHLLIELFLTLTHCYKNSTPYLGVKRISICALIVILLRLHSLFLVIFIYNLFQYPQCSNHFLSMYNLKHLPPCFVANLC